MTHEWTDEELHTLLEEVDKLDFEPISPERDQRHRLHIEKLRQEHIKRMTEIFGLDRSLWVEKAQAQPAVSEESE